MAYMPRSEEQFQAMRNFFGKDLAQASLALSQVVKGRNIRMMGALRDAPPEVRVAKGLLAHQLVNYCEGFLWSYFLPIFARYWSLRFHYEKTDQSRKLRKLQRDLQKFRGSYSLYQVCHEAGMTVLDMFFDQYHTISTMVGLDVDEDEAERREMTWIAADTDRMSARQRGQHAARDRTGDETKRTSFPEFDAAVVLARDNMLRLLEIEPSRPALPRIERKRPTKKATSKAKAPSSGPGSAPKGPEDRGPKPEGPTEEILMPHDDD